MSRITAAAVLGAMPLVSRAVVFYDNADPSANKLAPTGSLANSGWQYQFGWHGFLGTPIAPHYFLSADHIGGGVGNQFSYMGTSYTVTQVGALYGEDLRLFKVDNTFLSYAPLWDETSDGAEDSKTAVMIGRGGLRGSEVRVGNSPSGALLGWNWAAVDGIQRWGENKVVTNAKSGTELAFSFSRSGQGDYIPGEVGLVGGDSGGGVFIQDANNQWKLAGINYSVSGYYHYTSGGPQFLAALYDTRGLFDDNGNEITGGTDQPSSWFASRVGLASTALSLRTTIALPPTWNVNSSSSWNTPTNWANGVPANTSGAVADFRTLIDADRTVTLSGTQTVGTLDFDNAHRYTISGGTIALNTSSGNAQINVLSGSHTIGSALTISKDLDINVFGAASTLTLSGQMSAAGRTIVQVGLGTVEYKNVRATTLNLQQGPAKILSDGSSNGTSKVTNLFIPSNTVLDLTNNDLVISSGAVGSWNNNHYDGWTSFIINGRNSGAWNGNTGIKSSTAAGTNKLTGLGVANAGDVLNFNSGTKLWSGQTVVPSDNLIKYTYVGDMNLDGVITGDDYFRIDNGYTTHNTGYAAGDLDYNGRIDGDDYFLIDWNYSRQGSVALGPLLSQADAASGVQAVPEPAALSVAAMAGALLLRRGRRRH